MAAPEAANCLKPEEIKYIVDHIFLPRNPPPGDDYEDDRDFILSDNVCTAARLFEDTITAGPTRDAWSLARRGLESMFAFHHFKDKSEISGEALANCLADLQQSEEGFIPIFIRLQNAAVLVHYTGSKYTFSLFELSTMNKEVFATNGRLARNFPDAAVQVTQDRLSQDGFLAAAADFIAKMSRETAVDAQPTVTKAGQQVAENRDTCSPTMITQFFAALLMSVGASGSSPSIKKCTRHEILWNQAALPWTRSSFWLMMKVSIQLMVYQKRGDQGLELYKSFMIYLTAFMMRMCASSKTSSDCLHHMACKLSQRLHKMGMSGFAMPGPVKQFAETQLQEYARILEARKLSTVKQDQQRLDTHALCTTGENASTIFTLTGILSVVDQLKPPGVGLSHVHQITYDWPCITSMPSLSADILDKYAKEQLHGLRLFELWIRGGDSLKSWKMADYEVILAVMRRYSHLTQRYYSKDHIASSRSILNLLTLWTVLDTKSVNEWPEFAEYSPSFPLKCFDNLVLQDHHDYERLWEVETYIKSRHAEANLSLSYVCSNFGHHNNASYRAFEFHPRYGQALQRAEVAMKNKLEAKTQELEKQRTKYHDLIRRAESISCTWKTGTRYDRAGNPYSTLYHPKNRCQKCCLQKEARAVKIEIEEESLPALDSSRKAFIVELNPPDWLTSWREATVLLHQVFENDLYHNDSHYCTISQYVTLDMAMNCSAPSLTIASSTKPHKRTHRSGVDASTSRLKDVLLTHGPKWQYFDRSVNKMFPKVKLGNALISGKCIAQLCFKMPASSRVLDRFISRQDLSLDPNEMNNPNEAITQMSNCPKHLTLEEFYNLASLPYGPSLQWSNILLQLASPLIDLNKEEALIVILQCLYQTGAANGTSKRVCHETLSESLVRNILIAADVVMTHIEENWACTTTMSIIVAIVTRIAHVRHDCSDSMLKDVLVLLKRAREISQAWVIRLREKVKDGSADTVVNQKMEDGIYLLADTFSLPKAVLLTQLSCDEQLLTQFLETTILTSEFGTQGITQTNLCMRNRWIVTKFEVLSQVIAIVKTLGYKPISAAVQSYWSDFQPSTSWIQGPSNNCHELTCSSQGHQVYINLLTGNLLVNGEPATSLSVKIRNHPVCQGLFGPGKFDVIPSTLMSEGYTVMARQPIRGYQGHICSKFRQHNDEEQVSIALVDQDGVRRDLLPASMFSPVVPNNLIDGVTHWFNHSTSSVEFRPLKQAFVDLPTHWKMVVVMDRQPPFFSETSRWEIITCLSKLIPCDSSTFKSLAKEVSPLEPDSKYVEITLVKKPERVMIRLTRHDISFHMYRKEGKLYSDQFQGMCIGSNENLGTLFGIRNKLILRDSQDSAKAKVLILHGSVKAAASNKPSIPQFNITPTFTSRMHVYDVDTTLGRLIDNGTLIDKLYLAYLHAQSTVHCQPDTLTGVTGTERAIEILQSAAVQSATRISPATEEILKEICAISPVRSFYPKGLRVMETAEWRADLDSYSQNELYQILIIRLFKRIAAMDFLYRSKTKVPEFKGEEFLAERAVLRSPEYMITDLGANHIGCRRKDSIYLARCSYDGPKFQTCYRLMSAVFDNTAIEKHTPSYLNYDTKMWWKMAGVGCVAGSWPVSDTENMLTYCKEYIVERQKPLYVNFLALVDQLCTKMARGKTLNKANFALFLACLALDTSVEMELLTWLLSQWNDTRPGNPTPHQCLGGPIQTSHGCTPSAALIESVILNHTKDWTDCPHLGGAWGPISTFDYEQCRVYREAVTAHQTSMATELASDVIQEWPIMSPTWSTIEMDEWKWFSISAVKRDVKALFNDWFRNLQLREFLQSLHERGLDWEQQNADENRCDRMTHTPEILLPKRLEYTHIKSPTGHLFTTDIGHHCANILSHRSSPVTQPAFTVMRQIGGKTPKDRLTELISELSNKAQSNHQKGYIQDLQQSVSVFDANSATGFSVYPDETSVLEHLVGPQTRIDKYVKAKVLEIQTQRQKTVDSMYRAIMDVYKKLCASEGIAANMGPFIFRFKSRAFFLSRLSRVHQSKEVALSTSWKSVIIAYGIAISQLQRANRMVSAIHLEDTSGLLAELRNPGHILWNPIDQPDSLLLEIESNLLIREVQQDVAHLMMNPPDHKNCVTQLNMGEGKSSVIVPVVACALADGSRVVCVVVGKPQAPQMLQGLLAKLGHLVNRRVYQLPYTRDIAPSLENVASFKNLLGDCQTSGGILLVQPEHLLSLKLAGVEAVLSPGRKAVGRELVNIQSYMDTHSRFIVDESDENFGVKFELVYTMGLQQPIEGTPERWASLQEVLSMVPSIAQKIMKTHPDSVEYSNDSPGYFPRIRVLNGTSMHAFTQGLADLICERGLCGFPITIQSQVTRDVIREYIITYDVSEIVVETVDQLIKNTQWGETSKNILLLLRGLIGYGVLEFVFMKKRWRVDYGLDDTRVPPTRLAVPYRAKDSPCARAEFSHPDVVLALTSLSYYYGGLTNEQLFQCFQHLQLKSQAEVEYALWTRDLYNLPKAYRHFVGVNLWDHNVCINDIFPHMRHAKAIVDYFLAHLVFPKEMREFPQHISASGWDLGEVKINPTTGFSGTNDSRVLLPQDITQHDRPSLKGTNALVLSHLLDPKTRVALMPARQDFDGISDAKALLNLVTSITPEVRVILDVGAQILELNNEGVAREWLQMLPDEENTEAVIFFNDLDQLMVLDRRGETEPLQTSHYSTQLNKCLVFLDEAHTRGTDLKLPANYSAAVTLGSALTKDRLTQACMRMRRLGHGQTVVFCVPVEIQNKIIAGRSCKDPDAPISVMDILAWSINESWDYLSSSIPLWIHQGIRHRHSLKVRSDVKTRGNGMTGDLAERLLEPEAKSLAQRYSPCSQTTSGRHSSALDGFDLDPNDPIFKYAETFSCGRPKQKHALLGEEQERELAPEAEKERQVQRPEPAKPATPLLDKLILKFVEEGKLSKHAKLVRAWSSLVDTSILADFNPTDIPGNLLVTEDFATTSTTVEKRIPDKGGSHVMSNMVPYIRPVQWVLLSHSHAVSWPCMIVISPFEAQMLFASVRESKFVSMHLYSPRINPQNPKLESLSLNSVSGIKHSDIDAIQSLTHRDLPGSVYGYKNLIRQLNLFSGQVYLCSLPEYFELCSFLGLASRNAQGSERIALDGFILQDANGEHGNSWHFKKSPVELIRRLMQARRGQTSVARTHMGMVLDNRLLQEVDFEDDVKDIEWSREVHTEISPSECPDRCNIMQNEDLFDHMTYLERHVQEEELLPRE